MLKLIIAVSVISALAAGPVNCSSFAGPPDPPVKIIAPAFAP